MLSGKVPKSLCLMFDDSVYPTVFRFRPQSHRTFRDRSPVLQKAT